MLNKLKQKIIQKNEGLTVIELLIAIAIAGIVFSLVASFFELSINVYNEGQRQTEEQHAVRLATNFVTRELRNATYIAIESDSADLDSNGEVAYYIYVNSEHKLVKYEKSSSTATTYSVGDLDDLLYGFSIDDNLLTMNFTSEAEDPEVPFELTTEVLLNNIQGASGAGKYIGYSK